MTILPLLNSAPLIPAKWVNPKMKYTPQKRYRGTSFVVCLKLNKIRDYRAHSDIISEHGVALMWTEHTDTDTQNSENISKIYKERCDQENQNPSRQSTPTDQREKLKIHNDNVPFHTSIHCRRECCREWNQLYDGLLHTKNDNLIKTVSLYLTIDATPCVGSTNVAARNAVQTDKFVVTFVSTRTSLL